MVIFRDIRRLFQLQSALDFSATINYLSIHFTSSLAGRRAHRRAMPGDDVSRLRPAPRADARRGGVMILFYPSDDNQTMFPLIQRHEYGGVHSGQISLPGGKREPEDPDLRGTALRETREEIGIRQEDVSIVGELTEVYIPPSNFRVTPVLGYLPYTPVFVPDPYEVYELLTIPLSELLHRDNLKYKNMEVRQRLLNNVPYYSLNGSVVWGATAMILSEVIDLFENFKLT